MDASLRYASFSMTRAEDVIPSISEESSMDASLRYASFSMTAWKAWMLRSAQHEHALISARRWRK